jgi:caffeoyl-CoA O-methyltransferase
MRVPQNRSFEKRISRKERWMAPARSRSRFVDDAVVAYGCDHTSPPDELQLELAQVTQDRTGSAAGMQIGSDQAVFMEILARSIGARHALEVGTFTGYSALAVARGMGPDGRLLCCDVSEEWTGIAREYWEKAGVSERIELRIGPALETLRSLPESTRFDLAFLDADKVTYPEYYEEIIPRLRPGGLLIVDNTLQSGRVLDSSADDESTVAVRKLNDRIVADERVRTVLLPIGDGVTLAERL